MYCIGEGVLHHDLTNIAHQGQPFDSLLVRHPVTVYDLAKEELGFTESLLAELQELQSDALKINHVTLGELRARQQSTAAAETVLQRLAAAEAAAEATAAGPMPSETHNYGSANEQPPPAYEAARR